MKEYILYGFTYISSRTTKSIYGDRNQNNGYHCGVEGRGKIKFERGTRKLSG